MDRALAAERIGVIKERYDDHLAIAGKTTDMLDDFGFLLDVATAWLSEGKVQMAVPVTTLREAPRQPHPSPDGDDEEVVATTADGTQGMKRGVYAPPKNGGTTRPKAARRKRGAANSRPQGWSAT